jgi:hypothetical protein
MVKLILLVCIAAAAFAGPKRAPSSSSAAAAPAEKSKAAQFLTFDTPAQTFDAVIFQRKNFNDLAGPRLRARPRYQPLSKR